MTNAWASTKNRANCTNWLNYNVEKSTSSFNCSLNRVRFHIRSAHSTPSRSRSVDGQAEAFSEGRSCAHRSRIKTSASSHSNASTRAETKQTYLSGHSTSRYARSPLHCLDEPVLH